MTGKEVATAADISEAMYSGYQSGTKVPNLTTLGKLLDALGSNLTELDRLLRWLAFGPRGEPPLELRAARALRGVWVPGHVITAAEAEVASQLFRAVDRLVELGAPDSDDLPTLPAEPRVGR